MTTIPPSDDNIEHYREDRSRAEQHLLMAAYITYIGFTAAVCVGFLLMGLTDEGWQARLRIFLTCVSVGVIPGLGWMFVLLIKYVRDIKMFSRVMYVPPLVILILIGLLWWLSSVKA